MSSSIENIIKKTNKLNFMNQENKKIIAIPRKIVEDIEETDQKIYLSLVDQTLTKEQKKSIANPSRVFSKQDSVLAIHWHPEHIDLGLIMERVNRMFPNRTSELIIPTQHNTLTSINNYTGVEIDCYAQGFERKVQLLLHFEETKVENANVLKDMLSHTFSYRSSQLMELVNSIIEPSYNDRIEQAAKETGADEELIKFVQNMTKKFQNLFIHNESITGDQFIKNKLLRDFLDAYRNQFGNQFINRAQIFLKQIKTIMKENFPLEYFYKVKEVIEEARRIGGGIVVPHPEQFWPILLADYDIDGYEVWNPQSQQYTEFLIHVVNRQNKARKRKQRPLLIFMGDDTHMSEKLKDPDSQNPEKASREIGYQPAWDNLRIRKSLIISNTERHTVIEEYKSRLQS